MKYLLFLSRCVLPKNCQSQFTPCDAWQATTRQDLLRKGWVFEGARDGWSFVPLIDQWFSWFSPIQVHSHIHFIFTLYSFYIHYILIIYSSYIHLIFNLYASYIHFTCISYSSYIYSIPFYAQFTWQLLETFRNWATFRSQDGAVPVYIGLRAGRLRICGEDQAQYIITYVHMLYIYNTYIHIKVNPIPNS